MGIGGRMLLGKRAESIILGGIIDVFWGIAINILFPPSRLPRSSAIKRQTGGRHEWSEGSPQAVVSEFASIGEIRTENRDAFSAHGSPVSDSNWGADRAHSRPSMQNQQGKDSLSWRPVQLQACAEPTTEQLSVHQMRASGRAEPKEGSTGKCKTVREPPGNPGDQTPVSTDTGDPRRRLGTRSSRPGVRWKWRKQLRDIDPRI